MNTFPDITEKRFKKVLTIAFYSIIGLLVLCYFLKKRTPVPVAREIPKKRKKPDHRPRLSVSGSLITPSTLSTVSKLGRFTQIHLIFKVSSNEEEQKIKEMLAQVTNLAAHRVLFCETLIGYKAIIRQLAPKLHIEENIQCAIEMSPYLSAIALISPEEHDYFFPIPAFQDCQAKVIQILTDYR